MKLYDTLKFTPLEFETRRQQLKPRRQKVLKFTPLEFETIVLCVSFRK